MSRDQFNPIVFLTGMFFFNMLSRLGMAPLLPDIKIDLALSHSQAGGLFFLISSGYCASLFCSIFLTPLFSHRHLIVASGVAVGASLLAAAASQGVFMLQAGMVCLGLAGGFYLPSGVASLTGLVSRQHWGKVLGLHQLAPNLAYIVAPLAVSLFAAWHQSWRMVLVVYGTASLLLAVAYAARGKGITDRTDPPGLKIFATLFHTPAILVIAVFFILGMGLNQGVFVILPLYLVFERGFDPGTTNLLLAVSRIAAFGMPLAGGWLADRFGPRRIILAALFLSALGTLLMGWLPNSGIWLALILQAGAGVCVFPLCFAVMSMVTTPGIRPVAVSVVVPLAHFLGSGLVPFGIGILAETGRFNLGFAFLGGVTFLCLPLIRMLKKQS
ncbi:MAG: MFS transporter [Desulfotignum sp.]|nr:MFS transporter [Desulfotignum sp.]